MVNTTPSVAITSSNGTTEWCAGTGSSVNLTANVSSGNGAFTYSWNGTDINPTTAGTATVNPSAPGQYNYTVTVTDAANCTATASSAVIVDSVPVADAGGRHIICNGTTITLGGSPTASAGNPGYTYTWSGGAGTSSNPSITPSSSAVYVVTVTDSKGCTATAASIVTVRNTPVASAGTSPVTLPGCSPSGIQIGGSPTASGGSGGPFTYSWSPSTGLSDSTVANPTVTGISSNTVYTVIVTDINSCTASAQVTVNVTNAPPVVTITSNGTSEWCAGTNTTVNLTASVSNGSAPFSYLWSGTGPVSPTNGAVASVDPNTPGIYVYTVVVKDGFNCTATANDTITVDSLPGADAGGGANNKFAICYGSSVKIGDHPTASGGIPPYTYAWSNGASPVANPTVSPLTTTTYIVTVTDSKGCTATSASTVVVRPNPVASAGGNQTLQTCSPTGVVIGGSPTASGGDGGPYTYLWSPSTDLSDSTVANPTVTGLSSNTLYTVIVTDAHGCTGTSSMEVTVDHTSPSVSISPSGSTQWCANTGTSINLTANVINGTPTTYSWSGSDISPINSSVATVDPGVAGSYVYGLTVTDVNGCTATDSITVTVDTLPVANAGNGFAVCNGGSVVIGGSPTASSGTSPYSYTWDNGAALIANPTVSPDITTTYIVTVTDSHGCIATSNTTVIVHPVPTANAGLNQNITTCPDDSVILGGTPTASGGTPSYAYVWAPAYGLNDSSVANPVVMGITSTQIYNLVVSDQNGCTATAQVAVSVVPSTLQANVGGNKQTCSGINGCVQLGGLPTVLGGVGPYVFNWSNQASLDNPSSSNPVACPDSINTTYTVTITDSKGCSVTASQTVVVNPSPTASAGDDTSLCVGNSVKIGGAPTASGGTGSYTYSWSPTSGLSLPNISNPYASPTVITTYELTVTDSKNCSATAEVTVTANSNPIVNAGPDKTMTSCIGDTSYLGGLPDVTSGGTSPFIYSWTPGTGLSDTSAATPYVTGLTTTTSYELIVTDSNGCKGNDFVVVNIVPSTIQASAGNNQTICGSFATPVQIGGSPTATGGSSPYTYNWFPAGGLSSTTASNPTALPNSTTTYYVTVTDAKGCTSVDSVIVTVHPAPVANAGNDTAVCSGFPVILGGAPTATGGTPGYQYSWSPTIGLNSNHTSNPSANVITTSTFEVTVTDTVGCKAVASVTIVIKPNPTANAGTGGILVACAADSLQLGGTPSASGGSAPYTYLWFGGGLSCYNCPNPYASHLGSGVTYTLVVTDSNGCSAESQVSVTVKNPTLIATAGNGATFCQGSVTPVTLGGSPTAAGGNGVYTYAWSPGTGLNNTTIANPTATPTATTTYYVVVTDGNGCVASDSVRITVNLPPVASVNNDTSVCAGGSVALGGNPTASGGAGNYTYMWSPGTGLSNVTVSNPNAFPTTTTTYCVTVTDTAHCSASVCQTVTVNSTIAACAGPPGGFTMTNCPGSFVQIGCTPTATGGSGNYSYTWSPDSVNGVPVLNGSTVPNPIVTGLTQTTLFSVTVTDNASGCSATAQVNVNVNPSSLTANAGNPQIFCGESTNCITIGGNPASGSGGLPPLQYAWSPIAGLNNPSVSNPCVVPTVTTTYVVTVTDRLGCNAVDSVTITVDPQISVNAGDDSSICAHQSVTLGGNPEIIGGTGSFTYSWSPSANLSGTNITNPVAQNLTLSNTYTLVVTDLFQCTASGSVAINVRPLPTVNAGPPADIYPCAGDSAVLGGTPTATGTVGPYTYSWTPPFNLSLTCLTCPNPVVSQLGHTTMFNVTVTDSFGCQNSDSTLVTVIPNTVFANATPASLSALCANVAGSCVTLGGSPAASGGVPGYTYSWTGGILADSVIAHPQACPTATTTYTLIVTDSKGCQAADSVTVIVNTPPVVNVLGLNSQYCINAGNVSMTGLPAGGTFSGPGVTGNIFQPLVVGAGNWCIKYAYTDVTTGCSADTIICVTVNPLPVVTISNSVSVSFCQSDGPSTLIGTPAGGVFSGPGISGSTFLPG